MLVLLVITDSIIVHFFLYHGGRQSLFINSMYSLHMNGDNSNNITNNDTLNNTTVNNKKNSCKEKICAVMVLMRAIFLFCKWETR